MEGYRTMNEDQVVRQSMEPKMDVLLIAMSDDYVMHFKAHAKSLQWNVFEVDELDETITILKARQFDYCIFDADIDMMHWQQFATVVKGFQDKTHLFVTHCGQNETNELLIIKSGVDLLSRRDKTVDIHIALIENHIDKNRSRTVINEGPKESMLWLRNDLKVNKHRLLAYYGDARVSLTQIEMTILECLHGSQGEPVSREDLFDTIYPFEEVSESKTRNIDVHVKNIREKLGYQLIATQRGVGYYMNMN